MPKRSPAKPIDWNADLLSRKRPAAAPRARAGGARAGRGPHGAPAWKQLFGQRGERHPGRHRGHQSLRPRARGLARCAAAYRPRRGRDVSFFGAAAQAGHQRGGTDGPRAVRILTSRTRALTRPHSPRLRPSPQRSLPRRRSPLSEAGFAPWTKRALPRWTALTARNMTSQGFDAQALSGDAFETGVFDAPQRALRQTPLRTRALTLAPSRRRPSPGGRRR